MARPRKPPLVEVDELGQLEEAINDITQRTQQLHQQLQSRGKGPHIGRRYIYFAGQLVQKAVVNS